MPVDFRSVTCSPASCCRRVPSGGFGSTPSLPALGYKSPNERLNIASVGVGIHGPAILVGAAATDNMVAVCDVDEQHSARGFAQYPNAKKYKDYRGMFDAEKGNIDAVMITAVSGLRSAVAYFVIHQRPHQAFARRRTLNGPSGGEPRCGLEEEHG